LCTVVYSCVQLCTAVHSCVQLCTLGAMLSTAAFDLLTGDRDGADLGATAAGSTEGSVDRARTSAPALISSPPSGNTYEDSPYMMTRL
jgi:hypothetical protein